MGLEEEVRHAVLGGRLEDATTAMAVATRVSSLRTCHGVGGVEVGVMQRGGHG